MSVVEGATDSEAFEAYDVEHFLAPTLKLSGQVVVLDGPGAYTTEKVKELVEERGAQILCSCPPTTRRT